ncbi:IclR family transcriptional regulator [Haloarculaceae archaeon H-GB11]|nr:IclR family transcriptional regulator [Haloarculaceae archaeon H-GB11]
MTQKEVPIRSVETTFRMLEALRRMEGGTVSAVAERLDIPVSTAHVHLNTLRELEYVTQDGDEYTVGLRFLGLGESARSDVRVADAAEPELEKLATETGEVAHLMVEEHGWGVHLLSATGEDAVPLDTYVGKRIRLHQTGRGKAILAKLSEERRDEIFEARGLPAATPNTVTDREDLRAELETVSERGYAIDEGERIDGLGCVAAPITDDVGEPVGAISVAGPLGRVGVDRLSGDIAEQVLNTANVIEFNLNFS